MSYPARAEGLVNMYNRYAMCPAGQFGVNFLGGCRFRVNFSGGYWFNPDCRRVTIQEF